MHFLNGTGILNSSYPKTAGKLSFKNKNISDCFSYNMLRDKKKKYKMKRFLRH